ncbi:hypothetical protein KP003_17195 [Geomonas nitrogeniifigens]|uniref:hypothetical protein n=1 Tax=Geomonas diazotrophica TaxID=2843197 RepID=UPI001C2BEFD0|nr:hypothetical protein [Geomonas nitrogeniifigens]QXE86077.1 hypothetical protein KP003_17195 [Geomonas nitrogeniifigens]
MRITTSMDADRPKSMGGRVMAAPVGNGWNSKMMKNTGVIINSLLFVVLSAPPLLAEYLTAEPGNVPGKGFDVLCYEPFDYAYILMALAVFSATNILIAYKRKRPIRQAGLYGGIIAIGWFIFCFIAVGSVHLELGGKL